MKRTVFFKNAAILTITSLLLRSAGMIFRIYTSGVIGAEGMGVYQLILSVYVLASTFATAGISTAVTRLVTDALAQNQYGHVKRVMLRSVGLSVGIGVISAIILYSGADRIGTLLLNDARTVPAIRILGLGLPFMGVTACLRGYFLARRRTGDSSLGQLLEQAIRMLLIWYLLTRLHEQNITRACAAILIGDVTAEGAACLFLWLRYRSDRRSQPVASRDEPSVPLMRPLLQIAIPITAGRYLSTALRTIENILVPSRLTMHCGSREQSLSSFGALKGMALPLLFFPSSFLGAFSMLLIPEISEANTLGHTLRVQSAVRRTLRLTLLSSFLIGGIFIVYADTLGIKLYQSHEVSLYVKVLAPLTPIMYTESVVDGILKGLGQQVSSLKYSMLDSATRIVMIWLIVPQFGMPGFLFVMLVSNLLTCFLNIHRLLTVTSVRFEWGQWVILPLISVGVASVLSAALVSLTSLNGFAALCVGGIVTTAVYLPLLLALKCLKTDDLPLHTKQHGNTPLSPLKESEFLKQFD